MCNKTNATLAAYAKAISSWAAQSAAYEKLLATSSPSGETFWLINKTLTGRPTSSSSNLEEYNPHPEIDGYWE